MITKQEIILSALIERGEKGLNAEEAINIGSTCLNSDVSALGKLDLLILRKWEILPRKQGGTKRYMRYWLDEKNIIKANELINFWKIKRKIKR
ncbi:hypothetical protein [Pseudoalteromonas sp. meg-B1]|uniref:hypothetical protein n=1 Tax=Pseudoalteromonas sp. meg-B1 TaxID=2203192 RepID=UPI000D700141|nr:hypothetical protein [Pseudoalteromonas sp. meg-B1]PWS53249.1 hypothetical protein DK924_18380 [Pseudoalteromonas sp. meg-B1]